MSEKFLNRKDTPFGEKVWQKIDEAVVAAAKSQLSGRRLLHIQGPYGLGYKALSISDKPVDEKTAGSAKMTIPCVAPLAVIHSEFTLPARDIAAFEQSGEMLDLSGAARAAIDCARQEDNLVFNGSKAIGLKGLLNIGGTCSAKLKQWDNIGAAANDIIEAVTTLDKAGFHGPYVLGLAPELYNLLLRLYPQGTQTELEHIRQIVTDGVIKMPAITSGGLLLCSNGPFASIVLGQDLMAGFIGPVANEYQFTVSESVALCVTEAAALCILKK